MLVCRLRSIAALSAEAANHSPGCKRCSTGDVSTSSVISSIPALTRMETLRRASGAETAPSCQARIAAPMANITWCEAVGRTQSAPEKSIGGLDISATLQRELRHQRAPIFGDVEALSTLRRSLNAKYPSRLHYPRSCGVQRLVEGGMISWSQCKQSLALAALHLSHMHGEYFS